MSYKPIVVAALAASSTACAPVMSTAEGLYREMVTSLFQEEPIPKVIQITQEDGTVLINRPNWLITYLRGGHEIPREQLKGRNRFMPPGCRVVLHFLDDMNFTIRRCRGQEELGIYSPQFKAKLVTPEGGLNGHLEIEDASMYTEDGRILGWLRYGLSPREERRLRQQGEEVDLGGQHYMEPEFEDEFEKILSRLEIMAQEKLER